METRRLLPFSLAAFVIVATIAVPVFATYSSPLSSSDIRDAYFIGNHRDSQTADFLAGYVHKFENPDTDSYICKIGIDTPFTEIVKHSEVALNYHAPDAVEQFEGKPLPFSVTVEIKLNSNYPTVTGDAPALAQLVPDFWNDYKVRLIQGDEIKPRSVRGGPIYAYGWEFSPLVTGARIQAIYDPAKITADAITVQVVAPDGQRTETKFDLSELR